MSCTFLSETPEPIENYTKPGCIGLDRREKPGCCLLCCCSCLVLWNHEGTTFDYIASWLAVLTLCGAWLGNTPAFLLFLYMFLAWEPKYVRQQKGMLGSAVQAGVRGTPAKGAEMSSDEESRKALVKKAKK